MAGEIAMFRVGLLLCIIVDASAAAHILPWNSVKLVSSHEVTGNDNWQNLLSECQYVFQPTEIENLEEGLSTNVTLNISCSSGRSLTIAPSVDDAFISELDPYNTSMSYDIPPEGGSDVDNFTVLGLHFGLAKIEFCVHDGPAAGGVRVLSLPDYSVAVVRPPALLDTVFPVVFAAMLVVYNLAFGCKIQIHHVWEIIKRPVAPAVGFICQFVIMAPLAFGISYLVGLDDVTAMGLLAIGSCPGGGGSNVFAYLLDADLELSITMSFISTLCSMGMTPLWIWGLGRFFTDGNPRITIPVTTILASLAIVCVPILVGVAITYCKPRAGEKMSWCLKPFTAIIGVTFIALGTVAYLHSLVRVTWRTAVACSLLPAIGYLLGLTLGKITTRSWKQATTIGLETGFQNFALALLMLSASLPSPESDIAGVIPILYSFISGVYPSLAFIIYAIWKYNKKTNYTVEHPADGPEDKTDNDGSYDNAAADTV